LSRCPLDDRTGASCAVTVAATLLPPSIATLRVGTFPEHAPAQLVNTELGPAVAVSVTSVPAGDLPGNGPGTGTAPMEPSPIEVRASAYCTLKTAVTLLAASMVTWQGLALPEQSPDHPVNTEPASGTAVRVTSVPAPYVPVVEVGRAVIEPDPFVVKVSENCGGPAVAKLPTEATRFGPTGRS